ncbi:hypothetical protein UA08_01892 [Talaromyces atroroseus]|uniref:Uncharacterized protein n=1 Tax=Talaromyces atroroseus TaxID=1441469 RepID=A0A1Q5QA97_TALAT|nr:hypothetical protein UA08_01892 [Talaromyces atroroseus]OKL62728.1 hypothetical protein UA08_01892 [Talaromyces atroroseus]
MHSFVPVSLVATATLFSAVQGINILEPADGETVYASQGFDVVWTYDSSDFTNWEIELANPTPGALLATNVIQPSLASGATSTFTYHIAAFTGVADGDNYHVVMDPRNGGIGSYPESGAFTIVNGASGTTTTSSTNPTPTSSSSSSSSSSSPSSSSSSSSSSSTSTSATPPPSQTSTTSSPSISTPSSSYSSSHLPSTASSSSSSTSTSTSTSESTTLSVSTTSTLIPTTGLNSTIVSASTSFSTYTSGTVSSVIPQSTIYKTTVVGPSSTTSSSSTGTESATSSPTIALAAGGKAVSPLGLVSGVVGAVLGLFML